MSEATEVEIRRLDQLREAETKRVDALLAASEKSRDTALLAAEKAVSAALLAAEKAVDKAEQAQARVNATQNEFRGTLSDQAMNLMPRKEQEAVNTELRSLIAAQLTEIGALRSRIDIGPASLPGLQAISDERSGRARANELLYARLLAVGGIAVALASIVIGILRSQT